MSINTRFQRIIDTQYQGNKRAFANAISVSPTVVENIVGKRQGKPSFDVLSKVCAYANISSMWLLTGEGDMLRYPVRTEAHPVGKVAEGRKFSTATRPRIPLTAAAGELAEIISPTSDDMCERFPVITSFAHYDFTIIIEGDSMAPDYLPGDELACALVEDPADIKWGRPYVLDTERGIVFKRLYDGGDSIMCTSINPTGPSFIVDKTDIHHVAAVVGYLRAAQ